ncbi:uncharacterized protein LOC134811533 [Bolinopsis microptera]|uniref:uncharacterized protein LOC134811533 n=1 Tax=Bolinopsis microptera TaxID=2820187 RepID=UPI00307B06B0
MGLGGSVAVPEGQEDNNAIAKLVKDKNVWLGITRSESGDYVRQDDKTTLVPFSNWKGGAPEVVEGSASGIVLNADESSDELGMWYARSVNENHGTVCERVPRKLNRKRRSKV